MTLQRYCREKAQADKIMGKLFVMDQVGLGVDRFFLGSKRVKYQLINRRHQDPPNCAMEKIYNHWISSAQITEVYYRVRLYGLPNR